jgi:hypothetical protein
MNRCNIIDLLLCFLPFMLTVSSADASAAPPRNEKPLSEVLKGAAKQALGGGLPGAAAMAMQVSWTAVHRERGDNKKSDLTSAKKKKNTKKKNAGLRVDVVANHHQLPVSSRHVHDDSSQDTLQRRWRSSVRIPKKNLFFYVAAVCAKCALSSFFFLFC